MKIYGPALSNNVFRPILVAKHLGVPLERVDVALPRGEHKGPEYRAKNPFGRIPALEDNGFTLFESAAIAQYVADKGGGEALLPTNDPAKRAQITAWQLWGVAHLSKGVGPVQFQRLFKKLFGMGEPDEAVVEGGLQTYAAEAAVLEEQLGSREWLVGAAMTLADLDVAGWFLHAEASGLPVSPATAAWVSKIKGLPAWSAAAQS